MEMTNNTIAQNDSAKKARNRIKKLTTAAELSGFPNPFIPPKKEIEPDFLYSIIFNYLVIGFFGTPSEASTAHDLASILDAQAKANKVGEIISYSIAGHNVELVLRLNAEGEQSSHGAPAAKAFAALGQHLRTSLAGKSATWKAKVNGTTIADGTYQ